MTRRGDDIVATGAVEAVDTRAWDVLTGLALLGRLSPEPLVEPVFVIALSTLLLGVVLPLVEAPVLPGVLVLGLLVLLVLSSDSPSMRELSFIVVLILLLSGRLEVLELVVTVLLSLLGIFFFELEVLLGWVELKGSVSVLLDALYVSSPAELFTCIF
jgi:hypothetical protein